MISTPRVYLETLGCEKNLVDSQAAMGLLLQQGFRAVERPEEAELVVLNTCGFLAAARDESMDRIRELAELKGEAKFVVMGCFVQGQTHPIQSLVPQVDHVLGVGQYEKLAGLLHASARDSVLALPEEAPYAGYGVRSLGKLRHVAHIKIAEGCNQLCSFCKIPFLRGRQRSRPIEQIVEEARALVEGGVGELILIAQNTSAYGVDLPHKPRLGELCRALAELDEVRWIRIMYAFPAMFTDQLMHEVYEVEKVVSYLDIPIQHASPRILKAMGRGYDPARLRRQIETLRSLRPEIMLRTTALLGFPGEEEEDVVALLDFLAELSFDHLVSFAYSHEEQTPAFTLVDEVDPAEKEDRRARVEDLGWDLALERKRRLLGRKLAVVVDEVFENSAEAELSARPLEVGAELGPDQPVAFARSEGFCEGIDGGIWLAGDGLSAGQMVEVVPESCGPFDLWARAEPNPGGLA
jgi:ribosomal protein S12 methylthiotransferase